MTPRFWNVPPEPHPRDAEIVRRASMLKFHLYREEDGDLSGSFEIEGSFGNLSQEGNQEGVDDGLAFVRELMKEFTRRPAGR